MMMQQMLPGKQRRNSSCPFHRHQQKQIHNYIWLPRRRGGTDTIHSGRHSCSHFHTNTRSMEQQLASAHQQQQRLRSHPGSCSSPRKLMLVLGALLLLQRHLSQHARHSRYACGTRELARPALQQPKQKKHLCLRLRRPLLH